MLTAYDLNAPKRATNLNINSDLLQKAKSLNINLSATFEQTLAEAVKTKQQEAWLRENQTAIAAYNQQIEQHGVFGDELRCF